MKFRIKIMVCMLCLVSVLFGVGSSALILISFQNGLEQERDTAENSYRLLIYTLQMSGETETYSEEDIQDTLRQIAGQRGSYWDLIALSGDDGVLYSQGKAAEYLTRTEERGDEMCVWSLLSGQMTGIHTSGFQADFYPEIRRCIWRPGTIFHLYMKRENTSRKCTGLFLWQQ